MAHDLSLTHRFKLTLFPYLRLIQPNFKTVCSIFLQIPTKGLLLVIAVSIDRGIEKLAGPS